MLANVSDGTHQAHLVYVQMISDRLQTCLDDSASFIAALNHLRVFSIVGTPASAERWSFHANVRYPLLANVSDIIRRWCYYSCTQRRYILTVTDTLMLQQAANKAVE